MFVFTRIGHSTEAPTPCSRSSVEDLHQRDHAVLRDAVWPESDVGDHARKGRGRREVAALALLDDALGEGLDAVDDAPEVDVDHPAPVVVGHAHDRAAHRDARVEEYDVHAAHRIECSVGQGVDRLAVADVAHDALRLHAERADLRDRGVERAALDVGEHEAHALARERLCGGEADTARAARDHRHPIPQLIHRAPPREPILCQKRRGRSEGV
jgi:hypothetical protein